MQETTDQQNQAQNEADKFTEEIITENLNGNDLEESSSSEDETVKLRKEIDEYKDKYIRLVAEFDNYKRRSSKERIELIQTAGKEVITSLLEVVDDCDRAEKQLHTSDDINQVKQGVQLVFNKLRAVLQSKGLKSMDSFNTDFDVEKHEAITEIDAEPKQKGKVVDEIVKGYYLNDKLIRFAKVVVGK
ncbi:MAG: nucleotide exchange factor GrpE [Ginsengibacter sp.]